MKIGDYLLKRLKEINIDTIFGVPGDYNMPLLDLIEDDPELTWGNNANELNASYAADGYARVRGAGAFITTFGVGELSALNGVAGSYSEMLPVIHIVGTPSTQSQQDHALLHHSLGNGDFQVFNKMSTMITVASTHITSADRAIEEINQVIQLAYMRKRPGYIAIPIDLMKHELNEIPDKYLKPMDLKPRPNPSEKQEIVLKTILELIEKSSCPAIVVDGCVLRHHIQNEANAFAKASGFPTFTAPMGKGAIDEKLPNFRGCYSGNVTLEGITKEIEQADLLIEIGSIKSDFNTGNFSYGLEKKKTISLHSFGTTIYHAEYPGVGMMELLPLLTEKISKQEGLGYGERVRPQSIDGSTDIITHNYLWNKISDYLPPKSIILSETGTAEFGIFNVDAPDGAIFISQILWGSIGYTVGAALGAAMADRSRRVFLFVGDGSFQLTAQEVSVYIRQGITPVILLLNNDGYLIEKMIHGPDRAYNNFQMWEYSKTLTYFGGHLEKNKSEGKRSEIGLEVQVKNREEFEDAMAKVNNEPNKIHFVEVMMPKKDAPRELALLTATSANR
jgi:pyruvate decarboxylase